MEIIDNRVSNGNNEESYGDLPQKLVRLFI